MNCICEYPPGIRPCMRAPTQEDLFCDDCRKHCQHNRRINEMAGLSAFGVRP